MALPSDLSKLLGGGENPNGMIAQTPNGTVVNGRGGDGSQFRWDMADGRVWNGDPLPKPEALQPIEDEIVGATPYVPRGRVAVAGHIRRRPR
jgi:hypothetical protein